MPAITAGASVHFPVSDKWLNAFRDEGKGKGRYFDLVEVATSTKANPCQYLLDLVDLQEISSKQIGEYISRAAAVRVNGINNGIYVGTSGRISGRLQGEVWTDLWHNLGAGVVHPLRFCRIYAVSTTARQLKIIGVAQQ